MNKFKPNIIIGYPSAIKILGELAEQGKVKLSVQRVISCGEPLGAGLLGRSEDMLWFEDDLGRRDFLHPLAIEGFCVEGLRDYQFQQTERDSFVMLAERTSCGAETVIEAEITAQMRLIVALQKTAKRFQIICKKERAFKRLRKTF